jgi:hypothetical protein
MTNPPPTPPAAEASEVRGCPQCGTHCECKPFATTVKPASGPSAAAMEAADKLWQEWYEKFSDNYPDEHLTQLDIAKALDAFLDAHAAKAVEEVVGRAERSCNRLRTGNFNVGFNEGIDHAFSAIRKEIGK